MGNNDEKIKYKEWLKSLNVFDTVLIKLPEEKWQHRMPSTTGYIQRTTKTLFIIRTSCHQTIKVRQKDGRVWGQRFLKIQEYTKHYEETDRWINLSLWIEWNYKKFDLPQLEAMHKAYTECVINAHKEKKE